MWIAEVRAASRLVVCRAWRGTRLACLHVGRCLFSKQAIFCSVGLFSVGALVVSRPSEDALQAAWQRDAKRPGDGAQVSRGLLGRRRQKQEEGDGPVEVDAVFVTDCSDYQEWMTQVFLFHWVRAGHTEARLTRILSCETDDARLTRILDRAVSVRQYVEVFQLPELNGKGDDRYLCNNRPRGLRRWLQIRPPRSRNHWVVLLDPDMLLLRPLDVHGFWRLSSAAGTVAATFAGASTTSSTRLVDVPEGIALSHHFDFLPLAWSNINLSLPLLCSSPSSVDTTLRGCETNLRQLFDDAELVGKEYSIGVPHIIRAMDLQRMADAWEALTNRVRAQYRGWTAEMYSWLLAARFVGIRFAYLAEVVSDPKSSAELAWAALDASAAGSPADSACNHQAASAFPPRGPWLVHYCEVYNVSFSSGLAVDSSEVEAFYLDKRMIGKALRASNWSQDRGRNNQSASLLDCGAPLMEVPPSNLVQRPPPLQPGGNLSMQTKLFHRSAWLLCTTLHAVNDGLLDARKKTPGGCLAGERDAEGDQAGPKTHEMLRAFPMAVQLTALITKASGRLARPTQTQDWQQRLNATRARLRLQKHSLPVVDADASSAVRQ